MGDIPIGKAIESLRGELQAAMADGAGQPLRFEAAAVELELQATVTWSGEANAGVKWGLLEAGAKASRESATVQTVKLTLTPVLVRSDGTTTRPKLSGEDVPGADRA